MNKKSEYSALYKEIEVIGRGNFGSATLVRSVKDPEQVYIAKKVLLGSLNPKEADGAKQEVTLLKQLNHPNIVSYIESFIEDGVLIIIMEYCEEGDLAYFIKKRAQKTEYIEEKIILNWALQLCLALDCIHRQKILHRDIKSSNIFLTSNGTVKLGDFGISKVLENTQEHAMTVVGTPYYMSPEVCENKPYTFKSDIWALGCVLYELCTLKHAFSADNLLGLVFKIVRDKVEPIPKHYSPELSAFVIKLLQKNEKERPGMREIFTDKFIQKTMEEFIHNDGQYMVMAKIPIKKTALHVELKKNVEDEQEPPKKEQNEFSEYDKTVVSMSGSRTFGNTGTSPTKNQSTVTQKQAEPETAQQRIQRKKLEVLKQKEEEMKAAARQAFVTMDQAKQRKNLELHGSIVSDANNSMRKSHDFIGDTLKSEVYGGTRGANQSMVSNTSAFEKKASNQKDPMQDRGFVDTAYQDLSVTKAMSDPSQGTNKYNTYNKNAQTTASNMTIKTEYSQVQHAQVYYDDRPLPALAKKIQQQGLTDKFDKSAGLTAYYEEEFEVYNSEDEDDNEDYRLTNKASKNDLKDVINLYKQQLNRINDPPTPTTFGGLEEIREQSMESSNNSSLLTKKGVANNISTVDSKEAKINAMKDKVKQAMGADTFDKVYTYLKKHRELGTSDDEVQKRLLEMVGKANMHLCFDVDQIIFREAF